ncbi:MAG TPA: hypothetical protein PKD53_12385 [Chloroflexaceae bacterium]|nr:hypothetical protein [Chloroflexaceae bacterium]
MNNFVDLLKRAAALWWRARALWPLGMLAAFVGAGDLSVGGNANVTQRVSVDGGADVPPWLADLAASPLVRGFLDNPWPYVIGFGLALVGLSIVAALVGALAHGAMIRVADVADQGYAATAGDGLRAGAARVVPLFLINLILALPVIVGVLVVGGVVAMAVVGVVASTEGGANLDPGPMIASLIGLVFCALGFILLLWVVGALLGVWARVAQRVCVIEVRGPLASLGRAWGLIRHNLGLSLLTWLLQAILGGVASFILALPALGLAFPAALALARGGPFPVGLVVALVLYALLASVIVGGLLTAFNSAMWTVMFRAFVGRERPYESYGAA